MKLFDAERYQEFLIKHDVVGFKDKQIELSSKRLSHWYANMRNIAGDCFLLDIGTEFILDFVRTLGLKPDVFYGVPEGATPWGIATQMGYAKTSGNYSPRSHPLLMGRGKAKKHGEAKDRYFIGNPQHKMVVIEDVTTTANSVLEELVKLREANANIIYVVGLFNRMEVTPLPGKDNQQLVDDFAANFKRLTGKNYATAMPVAAAIGETGTHYACLANAIDILPKVREVKNPSQDIVAKVEQEFMERGVKPLRW